MALIKFNRDWLGFKEGQTVEVGAGKADAFVNYSRVAEYVKEPEPEKRAGGRPPVLTRRNAGPREHEEE